MRMIVIALSLLLLLAPPAGAQEVVLDWPGTTFDPAIPRLGEIVGHAPGEQITKPADALRYLGALAKAAPDRMRIVEYATSWEGRRLVYAVIGTPERIAGLDAIRADIAALADPRRTDATAAQAIIARLPGTVWLSYGVHGNEISSTDAALNTAYHLLAGRDARIAKILEQTLVFIDPMQNPDGRSRFAHHFEQALGIEPAADRLAAEHDEPWPGGRTNHYLFDLNRDWLRVSQPESKGRIAALRQWLPLVMVDAHEMGGDSSYFFAPEAVPYNPHLTAMQKDNLRLFGRNHAKYFDELGIDYFTREVFDAFFPGYGASWPSYYGGIAMTYEQASARGLVWRRFDGSELTYAESVRNHFVTSISTAEVVADNREKLWRDFYDYRAGAVEEGRRGKTRSYILPRSVNRAGTDELARLLAFHGIEVGRATADFRACGANFAAGAFIIDMAQPEKRRADVLLADNVVMEAGFVAEQERRRARGLPDEIYDVTAWSLPLMFNVEARVCDSLPAVAREALSGDARFPGSLTDPGAAVAFLVPWGEAPATRLLAAALRAGLAVKSADEAFTLDGGRRYPAGTLIFERAANGEDLVETLAGLARESGAEVIGTATSWVTEGPSFGSGKVAPHPAPRVALAWDDPTGANAAGNTRFLLEGRYGWPVTPIRADRLRSADLALHDVLILPAQSGFGGRTYGAVLGKTGADNLRAWVRAGGVLIALGSATDWLADPGVDLLSIRREKAAIAKDAPKLPETKEKESTVTGLVIESEEGWRGLIEPKDASPDSLPGAILRAVVDPDHWLAAGLPAELYAMASGRGIYTPAVLDQGVNVVRFAAPDRLVASGHVWSDNIAQLAFKPLVVAEDEGRGIVIAITQETTTRAYQDGLDLLLINAVFRGAQHARPVR